MIEFLIYIPLEDYLAQWFINHHGGSLPVKLRRGCAESDILEVFLRKRPPEAPMPGPPDPAMVPVVIPSFKYKPPQIYNYLPPAAVESFVRSVRAQFDIELFGDLFRFGNIGKRKDHLIYAWMESHGIATTDKSWNAIAKRYQRKHKATIDARRKSKNSI